jgi:hypothetical protein
MDFFLTINGYLFKHLCDVIFDGLLGVVYPWFVIQATSTLVGKVTVEKEWLAKKLKSLGLSNRKQLVEFKLSSPHMPHIDHTACNFDVGYVSAPYMVSMTNIKPL